MAVETAALEAAAKTSEFREASPSIVKTSEVCVSSEAAAKTSEFSENSEVCGSLGCGCSSGGLTLTRR